MDVNLIIQFQNELKEWCEDRMAIEGSSGSGGTEKWLALATALQQEAVAIRQKLVSKSEQDQSLTPG